MSSSREFPAQPGRQQSHPPLVFTVEQILAWADAHYARAGQWPRRGSGDIPEAPGECWSSVDMSLVAGNRGLPGGATLARLLAEQRAAPRGPAVRAMSEAQFLAWVAAHPPAGGAEGKRQKEKGKSTDGDPVPFYLLPFAFSLCPSAPEDLLAWHREARRSEVLPALTEAQILSWADAHHARAGQWPTAFAGLIAEAPGETWAAVNHALVRASRGLPRSLTLAALLEEQRGVPNPKNRPPLSERQILAWADAHFARHGRWPQVRSGPIEDAAGENWSAVNAALELGLRALPGGSSLAKLLADQRGARNRRGLPSSELLG